MLTWLSGPLCDAVTGRGTASSCSNGWSGATSLLSRPLPWLLLSIRNRQVRFCLFEIGFQCLQIGHLEAKFLCCF